MTLTTILQYIVTFGIGSLIGAVAIGKLNRKRFELNEMRRLVHDSGINILDAYKNMKQLEKSFSAIENVLDK